MTEKRLELFGIHFDDRTMSETLEYIQEHKSDSFRYIVTPNVDHIVRIHDHPETKIFYEEADLSVCDSRILKKLANSLHVPIRDVVPGSDLTYQIFENYLDQNSEITIIGGEQSMINKLLSRYPVKQCHHYNPPMGFIKDINETQKCVDFILEHQSPYTFFAVGSPQQEKVAYLLKNSVKGKGVGLCIGASLLFLTGEEKRAPKWVQKLSLEWLYRLLQNPKRLLKRYLVDDIKIFKLYLKTKY